MPNKIASHSLGDSDVCLSQWLTQVLLVLVLLWLAGQTYAQPGVLEPRLLAEGPASLVKAARETGDAVRGAIVFHRLETTCSQCHVVDGSKPGLGPDLTNLLPKPEDKQLVESILEPSRVIHKGYETVAVITDEGQQISGLLAEDSDDRVVLRDLTQNGRELTFLAEEVDEVITIDQSPMPTGLANLLGSRQEFLDLVRYLIEVRDGGPSRARELQPPPSLTALRLPAYEHHIDHAGILRDLDDDAFDRGRAIYERVCQNCHGTPAQPGSLPTSLRFASDRFKHGSDPYTMYQTLTRGFGLMAPQTWMVPQQKYDVIHFIRQAYLQPLNASQFANVTAKYLANLPPGDTRGPEPRTVEPWVTMDYGPSLVNTYEIGRDGSNFAQKGIAVRLDPGPGGISRGRSWMVFDHDTMRLAAAWTGSGFIDWNGIHFNGRHQVHPRVVGDVIVANPTGPGWAAPESGEFTDDARIQGRDGRRYGPLPYRWSRYRGLYHHGDRVIISYSVGNTDVLEMPGAQLPLHDPIADDRTLSQQTSTAPLVFTRALNIGPRSTDLLLLVATDPEKKVSGTFSGEQKRFLTPFLGVVRFGGEGGQEISGAMARFEGSSYLEVAKAVDFDMTGRDFTITARLRTTSGGTILAKTRKDSQWAPNAKAFFVRDGRLCYDIGWVGAVTSRAKINDGQWHQVALRWNHGGGSAELFVDGQSVGRRVLRPEETVGRHVLRLGLAAPDFPEPQTFFQGELQEVRFIQRAITREEIQEPETIRDDLVAHWRLETTAGDGDVADASAQGHSAVWHRGGVSSSRAEPLVAGLSTPITGSTWVSDGPRLCLRIPAGAEPLRFILWMMRTSPELSVEDITAAISFKDPEPDLAALTQGGPPRWPEKLTTEATMGNSEEPFAVDVLTHPESNPWLAQMRLTGLDFFSDPDRAAVCAWDGDVWVVSGLSQLVSSDPNDEASEVPTEQPRLTWQRIASGLFQPLGVKIVDDQIYITCRDQLVILRDCNDDGETDFYECFNNDHQVTEHFHEFAMGLQVDQQGNFYYAKSARHALPAVVPHHGTLLRIRADGSQTDILASGFRAANGVCLNPDGTFVVTDQEGHWNPKNRINWVIPGRFYGNMFGYHDVTDESDDAMEQPLCWITNSFDRSPAELLWVPQDCWGPLGRSLLNLSYGHGKLYVAPFEELEGQKQGGMCALPVGPLPTGVMRGRFHPRDRQLYTCGMFAWAGSATKPGGFYRIRYTGKPAYLPIGLKARQRRLEITFTEPLDRNTAGNPASYAVKTWSLKRTANYGSEHYNERRLDVTGVNVSEDGRTVQLQIPDLHPAWGMEVVCRLRSTDGQPLQRVIHNSIFRLAD